MASRRPEHPPLPPQEGATIQIETLNGGLNPSDDTTFLAEERVSLNAPNQTPGDVLKLVAPYRVNAGSNSDFSNAESVTFTVS